MRTHGVPAYPDPNSSGQLPKIVPDQVSELGVTQAQFTAAGTACQALWPYQAPTQAQEEQQLVNDLKFARCMRSHGLPNFPDPITDPKSGEAEFVLSTSKLGASPQSPLIQGKAHQCLTVLPPGSPLPHATEVP
jgi:hypothetical protein